jgi:hypothetical protein
MCFRHRIYAYSRKTCMQPRNRNGKETGHEHPLPREISHDQRQLNEAAHDEALHDIEEDPDLSAASPNDDLDEGETARLGENETDLV